MEETGINKADECIPTNEEGKEVVIEIQHLNKSFGDNRVLADMSLKLFKGENLVVLGKSGTGKSVLIKCMVKLVDTDSGTIKILGNNIAEMKVDDLNALRKKIGFLFQNGALYDSMTVRENLEFPLRKLSLRKRTVDQSIIEGALEDVGLADAIDKRPSELSGGMQKRIALARTLILKPEIMLYDEPTTGLDPVTAKEISTLILSVQKKYNTSSIIITHDMECARMTANRVVVVKEGACIAEGTYEELQKSKDEFVRSFFE